MIHSQARSGRTGSLPVLMMFPCETVNGKPVLKLMMPFVCQPARTRPANPLDSDWEPARHR